MVSVSNEHPWPLLVDGLGRPGAPVITAGDLQCLHEKVRQHLLSQRLLTQLPIPDTLGPCPCPHVDCERWLRRIDGTLWAICSSGDRRAERVAEDDVIRYEIDVPRTLGLFRRSNRLVGIDLASISTQVFMVGRKDIGTETVTVLFIRRLPMIDLSLLLHGIRGTVPSGWVVLLCAAPPTVHHDTAAQATALQILTLGLSKSTVSANAALLDWDRVRGLMGLQDPPDRIFTLAVDASNHTCTYKGRQLTLAAKPFKLLHLLACKAIQSDGAGFVLKDEIYEGLYGAQHLAKVYDRQIADTVRELRDALGRLADGTDSLPSTEVKALIMGRRGVGYRLSLPASEISLP